jgi:hypothetical protein
VLRFAGEIAVNMRGKVAAVAGIEDLKNFILGRVLKLVAYEKKFDRKAANIQVSEVDAKCIRRRKNFRSSNKRLWF